jgi:uncharacterized membrane-anchored protein YhcB (DUF1043 family)
MKNIPYKILVLCLVLPPVCYVLTIQSLESYLQRRENATLNDILIQHPDALYEGRYTVREEINRNISKYLNQSIKSRIGVRSNILVKTGEGQILYPPVYGTAVKEPKDLEPKDLNYVEVAAENYRILNGGLSAEAAIKIRYNSWLSIGILIFYVGVAGLILGLVTKRGLAESEQREDEYRNEMARLGTQLNYSRKQLEEVVVKEKEYLSRINRLKQDKQELAKDVDGLLEEMEEQEKGLQDQRVNREALEKELEELREKLQRLTEKGEKRKKKKGKYDNLAKRFRLLYKNLELSDRALDGFSELTDEFKLKAEEVIHQLNEDDSLISIKRKVFGKGGRMNVLEIDFAYSGRLYFQKNAKGRIRVLAIGTKNTQNQDLAFVESSK